MNWKGSVFGSADLWKYLPYTHSWYTLHRVRWRKHFPLCLDVRGGTQRQYKHFFLQKRTNTETAHRKWWWGNAPILSIVRGEKGKRDQTQKLLTANDDGAMLPCCLLSVVKRGKETATTEPAHRSRRGGRAPTLSRYWGVTPRKKPNRDQPHNLLTRVEDGAGLPLALVVRGVATRGKRDTVAHRNKLLTAIEDGAGLPLCLVARGVASRGGKESNHTCIRTHKNVRTLKIL